MGVGPEGVLSLGRARGVEEALLRDEDVGLLGMSSYRDSGLCRRDLAERSTEMNRGCTCALVPPRAPAR